MTVTRELDEQDLADFLRDDPELFLEALYEQHRERLMCHIRKCSFDTLDAEEQADVFQELMMAVWQKVREVDFEPERPLRMVFTIAKNKAIDAYRKKLRLHHLATSETDITDLVISDMQGSDLRIDWQLAGEEERLRFNQALPEIVANLPPRQKAAALAFLACYEEVRAKDKYRPVVEAMSAITGKCETVAAAKSALRAAFAKIREELQKRGLDLGKGRI